MIYYNTPYDTNKNIGAYYNRVMSELKSDEDWVVFTDRDTWFPNPKYGHIIEQYAKQQEYGLLTCYTNRVGTQYQCLGKWAWDERDMTDHVKIAKGLYFRENLKILDITKKAPFSGMLIMIKKSTWKMTNGFKPNGLLGVDNSIFYEVRNSGGKIGLMKGTYVWHYYRNGDVNDTRHLK